MFLVTCSASLSSVARDESVGPVISKPQTIQPEIAEVSCSSACSAVLAPLGYAPLLERGRVSFQATGLRLESLRKALDISKLHVFDKALPETNYKEMKIHHAFFVLCLKIEVA